MEPVRNGNRHGVSGVAAIPQYARSGGEIARRAEPATLAPDRLFAWESDHVRRGINVLLAALLLILLSPLMLLIALLVKLTSAGPVLYRQTRVGIDRRNADQLNGNWRRKVDHGGRLFQIYKFRTMCVNADRIGEVWASPDDPRVTAVGKVLRKYRLDELPQLFNVLKGDMNLVGPRPEQPKIFAELREQIDTYPARQRVLPGITGWAQINQHYDSCVEDVRNKVRLDLEYIERCSPTEDLRIVLRTVPVVVFQKGAW
jgi:lipopolysaccharide/colanic/teichoic acid biosynthesis glycosyltransferase